MKDVKTSALAMVVTAAMLLSIMIHAVHAAAGAVAVSDVQMATLSAACAGGAGSSACTIALQALVAALTAANPGAPMANVIGAIAGRAAELSNAAIANPGLAFNPAAVGQSLKALASFASSAGLADLGKTIGAIAMNVESKVSIDLAAIASGTGNAIPANPASPA